jgi:putative peptidoglycan lipid II flippase
MAIYYICIVGCLFLFKFNNKPEILVAIYFALAFLTILGFTMVNLGTLYRVRYAYSFIILALGVLGWTAWMSKRGVLKKFFERKMQNPDTENTECLQQGKLMQEQNSYARRRHVLTSASYVMALTLTGFLGFFYRDILMANIFGLGGELDNFFIALSIPMTLVTILCIPLGTAFTPVFLKIMNTKHQAEIEKIITKLSTVTSIILFVICIALYLFLPSLLAFILKIEPAQFIQLQNYASLLLLLLMFSGSVIIGNAVLNALGKAPTTAVVQLIVPVIAILALVTFGEREGIKAVIWGMILGQFLNLCILEVYMRRYGYSLKPVVKSLSTPFPDKELKRQYLPLMTSAFFISISIQVSILLAMVLPDGAVSTFSLGNKVILLITGVLGAALSAVVLPYFSYLISRRQWLKAKKELSDLLVLLTVLSVPFSIFIFIFIEPISKIIFIGLKSEELVGIISILKYAVVQIPFYACNLLLLKFATAAGKSIIVLLTAILGLVINVALSLILMRGMGVEGIMLGASLSMMISTSLLLITLMIHKLIKPTNTVMLLLWWLLFSTMLVMIAIKNVVGINIILFAAVVSIYAYRKITVNEFISGKGDMAEMD